MELNMVTIIGLVAAACTTFSFIPQLVKIFKTKRADDISMNMYVVLLTGVALWAVYGLIVKDLPIIAANFITLIFLICIVVLKILYRKQDKGS